MIDKKKLYCQANNNSKINGKKIVKNKQIQSKIFKNLSELPIEINLDGKQNFLHHNNRQNINQQEAYHKNIRVESALSQYQDVKDNKKRLSFDSTNKKYERDSMLSKNSFTKKHSKNQILNEEGIKQKLAEDRRKYNNSCCSALQERVKIDKKKMTSKIKRNSINSIQTYKKQIDKSQITKIREQKKDKDKDDKSLILKDKQRKQKSKNQKKRRQSVFNQEKAHLDRTNADKLKGSTTANGFYVKNERTGIKKKQSASSSIIHLSQKELKDKQKKNPKKILQKSLKIDQLASQYPINKYQNENLLKHIHIPIPRPFVNNKQKIKNRSKSGKGSASKDRSGKGSASKDRSGKKQGSGHRDRSSKKMSAKFHKKGYSLLQQINYSSCINIPSNSSGLIKSYTNSSENPSKIKILDHWQYQFISQQNPTSLNLDEIRYFQSSNYKNDIYKKTFIDNKFKNKKYYKMRVQIQEQISSEYPNFNELQLKFLASVVFIQRKWREHKLYKQIFTHYMTKNKEQIVQIIQKSNSKQLNISLNLKSNEKSQTQSPKKVNRPQVYLNQSQKEVIKLINSQKNNQELAQTQLLNTQILKEPQNISLNSLKIQIKQFQNDLSIELKTIDPLIKEQNLRKRQKKVHKGQYKFFSQNNKSNQPVNSPNSIKMSPRQHYQFLQNDIFPSITYLLIKKQQIKSEYTKKDKQIKDLHKRDIINYSEFNKLRQENSRVYQLKIRELKGSKIDIQKGYLKFIQNYKDTKHEALRKVSSEDDFMAIMYNKIFHFDQKIEGPGCESTESLKKLTKKILIRKQYYQTQLISSNVLHNSKYQENKYSQRDINSYRHSQSLQSSNVVSRRLKKKDIFLDLQFINNEQRYLNPLKEDYIYKSRLYNEDQEEIQNQKDDEELNVNNQESRIVINRKEKDEGKQVALERMKESYVEYINDEHLRNEQELLTEGIFNEHSHMQKYFSHEENQVRLIFQEVIAILTHELFIELLKIDQKRQNLVQIVGSFDTRRMNDIQDYEIIDQRNHEDQVQVVEEDKIKQIYKIQGIKDKINEIHRKHRNSNIYNISPASSERFSFDVQDILLYVQEFLAFIKSNDLVRQIVTNLNKNQGFRPLEYLKFLRDFQIPEDQYQPLISNEIFMQWEDYFYSKHFSIIKEENSSQQMRQNITIFHRCIFEAIISLIQEQRPYGQKGIPFPWENAFAFPKIVKQQQIDILFKICQKKVQFYLTLNCGIIDQKYIIGSQQGLEKVHEQNQDKIINMLEKQFDLSPHNWYQVEQHCLQIKIQIDGQILQYIILQALDDLLQAF